MKGVEFKRWAERGCRVYGDDPWFFMRELAQNARDAAAGGVKIVAVARGGTETVVFTDDGSGMALDHARRFLFRLYSSSKEQERHSAGQYGVGFWTVLKYGAQTITIESRTASGAWALTLHPGDFRLTRASCSLDRRGTRITLARPASKSEQEFLSDVTDAVARYCSHLRRNDRRASALPVWLNGACISKRMSVPGPISLAFRRGPVEGVVGLSDAPKVELLARGLPVWEGMLLDELSYAGTDLKWKSEVASGLAPVFLLNGNDLDVVMSRSAVIDNRSLRRVRRTAAKALDKLIRLHVESTVPTTWVERIWNSVRRKAAWVGALPAWAIPLVAGALLVGWFGIRPLLSDTTQGAPGNSGRTTAGMQLGQTTSVADAEPGGVPDGTIAMPASAAGAGSIASDSAPLQTIPTAYRGSLVEEPDRIAVLDLQYSPPDQSAWFKFLTPGRFDPGMGFVGANDEAAGAPLDCPCSGSCLAVQVRLSASGKAVLPVPTGYCVDPGSVTLDGEPLPRSHRLDRHAQAVVDLPHGGVLTYVCAPVASEPRPGTEADTLSLHESVRFPGEVEARITHDLAESIERKVETALELTRGLVRYDDSSATVLAYAAMDSITWLDFVLQQGDGDCDVINAVNVLILRKLGVHARLAIGVVGKGGKAVPGLHAWTEYYRDGWKPVDASAVRQPPPISDFSPGEGRHQEPVLSRVSSSNGAPHQGDAAPTHGAIENRKSKIENWYALLAAAACLLGLAALWLLATALRPLRFEGLSTPKDRETAEKILAQMALSVLSQPEAWRRNAGFRFSRVLPTIDGRRLSLHSALRLASAGRLYSGKRGNPLAGRGASVRAWVLDSSNPDFRAVARQIPGIVDLDLVAKMNPVIPEAEEGESGRSLFGLVNMALKGAGSGEISCLPCPGLTGEKMEDVDLTSLGLSEGPYPARFVAVPTSSPVVEECLRLFETSTSAAAFKVVDAVLRESRFFTRRSASKVRARAAVWLLGAQE